STIPNPAGISTSSPAAVQPNGAADDGAQFNQVLSREIADRRNAESKPAGANAPAQSPSQSPTSSNKAGSADEDKPAEDTHAAPGSSDAPAQMLALAAQFAQNIVAAAPSPAAPAADPLAAGSRIGKDALTAAIGRPGTPNKKTADAVTEKGAMFGTSAPGDALERAGGEKFSQDLILARTQIDAAKMHDPQPAVSAAAMASLQQAAFDKAQTLAGHPVEKLTPQVGSPGWDQALGQKVVWMVAGGQQSASLTLNPPDLGPLQVVLNVSNSHATASFTAAQPEVRQALEAALPKLREMLGDAGIQLGQASVNAGTSQQQHAFAEPRRTSNHNESADTVADRPLQVTRTVLPVVRDGLVDTFA
ncbi:MAG: putative flagellar hook-length control protein FliK, partial [Herminiimonas sp.]|nr:putative flagellar hook-length control protein FliK [Herminiimonas sp.]